MKSKYFLWFLIGFIVFHLLNNLIIIKLDTVPPLGHPSMYYDLSIYSYNSLLRSSKEFIRSLLWLNPHYPPLLYVSAVPFYFLFGVDYDIACMAVGILYLTLLLVCVYLIGKYLFGNQVGLLAAFLCSFFPCIFGYSRMFTMALPTVAFLALDIYLMVRSDYFKKSGYAALFGLSVGLGMLAKRYHLVSLFGIFLVYLFIGRRQVLAYRKKVFLNLLLAVVVITAIAGPWYLKNIDDNIWQLRRDKPTIFFNEEAKIDFLTYIQYIYHHQIGIVFFSLFICCFLYLLFRKKLNFLILSWLLWPYFIYSLIVTSKAARYTMSILPAIALLIAQAIVEFARGLKGRKAVIIKPAMFSVICVYAIYNFFYICYAKSGSAINAGDIDQRWYNRGLHYPRHVTWDIEELVEVFLPSKQDQFVSLANEHPPVVVDAFGCDHFLNQHLRYVIQTQQLTITYMQLYFDHMEPSEFESFLEKADFLIMRSEDGSDSPNVSSDLCFAPVEKIRDSIEFFNIEYKSQFVLAKKMFGSPDNAFLIYKRIK